MSGSEGEVRSGGEVGGGWDRGSCEGRKGGRCRFRQRVESRWSALADIDRRWCVTRTNRPSSRRGGGVAAAPLQAPHRCDRALRSRLRHELGPRDPLAIVQLRLQQPLDIYPDPSPFPAAKTLPAGAARAVAKLARKVAPSDAVVAGDVENPAERSTIRHPPDFRAGPRTPVLRNQGLQLSPQTIVYLRALRVDCRLPKRVLRAPRRKKTRMASNLLKQLLNIDLIGAPTPARRRPG